MFGKKKLSGTPVQHYEGLDFPANYPCRIEIIGSNFVITRIKPETTVTLPLDQIKSFSAMEEPDFMLKYHGEAKSTSKAKGINKYYLVVDYTSKDGQEKRLVFWGTVSEYGEFVKFQFGNAGTPGSYSL